MLAAVRPHSLQYGVQFLYARDNEPVRGAAIGIARRAGRGWTRDVWSTTDSRGRATFALPGYGDYRLATSVRRRRQEVVVSVVYAYQTNRLWALPNGALHLERFVP